jgi:putative membrane protein
MHHWGFGFWPLFPLVWLGIIVFFCWGIRRWVSHRERGRAFYATGERPFEANALEILRRRFARGEIDGTTFDQMSERLERSGRPRD